MIPLRVEARLQDAVSLTLGRVDLDALLMSLYCMVHRIPPLDVERWTETDIPIPVQKEPGGRFYLCSTSVARFDQHEAIHYHKALPVQEVLHRTKVKRARIDAGIDKSYRISLPLSHAEGDTLTWWCVGEQDGIEELVQYCHHLGKKRSQGMGKVLDWSVAPCESWGDGFPILLAGKPMRNLPIDYPGMGEHEVRLTRLMPPYWVTAPNRVLCAVPEVEST